MPPIAASLVESATAVARFGETPAAFAAMDAPRLLTATRAVADLRRHVDHLAALAAAEIARRSRRDLGHRGLAQEAGYVNPVAMVQAIAQVGRAEASRQVETGTMIAGAAAAEASVGGTDGAPPDTPDGAPAGLLVDESREQHRWQSRLAAAITDGRMSLEKVDAIRRVMSDIVQPDRAAVDDAVIELVRLAPEMSPEQLVRAARRARDVIDHDGIERREKQQRDLRSVRTWWDANGMHCGSWRLAPEEGALVAEAFDQILSPRRGGPRFVDPVARHTAETLIDDIRSDEQIAADAFSDLVRLAVDADPGTVFGSRRPSVRLVVTADRLEQTDEYGHPTGHGHLESRHDAVGITTIDRQICNSGVISIAFDTDGRCVNVGRDHRLFTERQRIGMAVRDGGCRFPGCDRPPSYCEAHHIDPWHAKHGRTDIDDGILLCRRHHLLIHDNGWRISRDVGEYTLIPPRRIDPRQTPLPMPSRSPMHRDLHGQPGLERQRA